MVEERIEDNKRIVIYTAEDLKRFQEGVGRERKHILHLFVRNYWLRNGLKGDSSCEDARTVDLSTTFIRDEDEGYNWSDRYPKGVLICTHERASSEYCGFPKSAIVIGDEESAQALEDELSMSSADHYVARFDKGSLILKCCHLGREIRFL